MNLLSFVLPQFVWVSLVTLDADFGLTEPEPEPMPDAVSGPVSGS